MKKSENLLTEKRKEISCLLDAGLGEHDEHFNAHNNNTFKFISLSTKFFRFFFRKFLCMDIMGSYFMTLWRYKN